MDLELKENRGSNAEDRLEAMKKCSCMESISTDTESCYVTHGTTVTLALAPVLAGTAKKNRSNSRLRKVEDTVKKVIAFTAGFNSEIDGIGFTLNGEKIKPLLHLDETKGNVEANKGVHKTKFSKFNKDVECYKAKFT
eukprot:4048579-Ditylum_brightwellii.AAC.1